MAVATKPVTSTSITEVNAAGIDTQILNERTERHFCKCASCKQASAIDFKIVIWEFAFIGARGQIVWEPRTTSYNEAGEEVRNTYIATCPKCGAAKPANSELKASKIKYDPNHVCTDSCQKATSDHCTCSCKGENHGIKNKVGLF
jgi:hypothetical protein